jgi:hypothetical protein
MNKQMKIKIGVAAGLIVGMLAWWGIMKYNEHSEKLAIECYKNRWKIASSAELYPMEQRSHFPGTFDALISAGYFKEIPTCPAGGTYTLYQEDQKGDNYKCTCSIEKHENISIDIIHKYDD